MGYYSVVIHKHNVQDVVASGGALYYLRQEVAVHELE